MDPATMQLLGALFTGGAGLLGGLFGGKGQEIPKEQRMLMDAQRGLTTSQTKGSDLENLLQQLLIGRKQAQDPMFRAVQQMAFSRLPVFARQGITQDMSQPIAPASLGPAPLPLGGRPRGDAEVEGYAVPRNI